MDPALDADHAATDHLPVARTGQPTRERKVYSYLLGSLEISRPDQEWAGPTSLTFPRLGASSTWRYHGLV